MGIAWSYGIAAPRKSIQATCIEIRGALASGRHLDTQFSQSLLNFLVYFRFPSLLPSSHFVNVFALLCPRLLDLALERYPVFPRNIRARSVWIRYHRKALIVKQSAAYLYNSVDPWVAKFLLDPVYGRIVDVAGPADVQVPELSISHVLVQNGAELDEEAIERDHLLRIG